MASAKHYLIITGDYVKVATYLMRALFCLKVSLNVHQAIILEKQYFLVYLTSLLPPSTSFIFSQKSLPSLWIMLVSQHMVWHRSQRFWIIQKNAFFIFIKFIIFNTFSCGFLRRFWFLSCQVFWISWNLWWAAIHQTCKTSFCYNCYLIFIKILFFSSTLSMQLDSNPEPLSS